MATLSAHVGEPVAKLEGPVSTRLSHSGSDFALAHRAVSGRQAAYSWSMKPLF
jgi:hypothetical protein